MSTLSVITVNKNNCIGLRDTLKSIFRQNYSNCETIVIDGASNDSSIETIKTYSAQITLWVSEPDQGIYHAMNKGIQKATGDYLLFLNSGDWLASPTVLEDIFKDKQVADIICGDIYFYDNDKQKVKWLVKAPDTISAKTLFYGYIPHQACLIKRKLFDKVGLYRQDLKIASDWAFFLDAFLLHGASYSHYPGVISYFSTNGISCRPGTNHLPRQEQILVLKEKYPLFMPDYEQMEQLELANDKWLASREYRAFKIIKRIGILDITVFFVRIGNFVKRRLGKR